MAGWKVSILQFVKVDTRSRNGFYEEQHEEINKFETLKILDSAREESCIVIANGNLCNLLKPIWITFVLF